MNTFKVLLVNGSPHKNGCTNRALEEVAGALRANGVESEILWLGTKPIAQCMACGKCRETGRCVFGDSVVEIVSRAAEFDALVFGSPVYYAAASGQLTSFLNRLFFSSRGAFAGKLGAAVVSCRRGGAAAAFEQINKYFTISNMPIVSSQYWNQVHGSTPDEVEKDSEGLQTMRILGNNMAWLLKCIDAGKQSGVSFPTPEQPRIWTNFVR